MICSFLHQQSSVSSEQSVMQTEQSGATLTDKGIEMKRRRHNEEI